MPPRFPRQFHLRTSVDLGEAIDSRARELGLDTNEWLRRAAVYALELGKAHPAPPRLELPWSALL